MTQTPKDNQIWVSHTGITLKFRFSKWIPFKRFHQKMAVYLVDHMTLVTIYDAETGATGEIKERVWEAPKVL